MGCCTVDFNNAGLVEDPLKQDIVSASDSVARDHVGIQGEAAVDDVADILAANAVTKKQKLASCRSRPIDLSKGGGKGHGTHETSTLLSLRPTAK